MLSAMIGMPDGAQLVGGPADVAAHDRAREDEQPGARQVGDGAHGAGDVLLAHERDRVHGDPLAAQVVAVRLGHRAERDLRHLRAAADDDDPLAEHRVQRPGRRADRGRPARRPAAATRASSSASSTSSSTSTAGPARRVPARRRTVVSVRTVAADRGDARRDRGHARRARPRARGGRRRWAGAAAACGAPAIARSGARPADDRGREVASQVSRPGPPAVLGRVVLLEGDAERGERLARRRRVAGGEHQRAVGVLGDAHDAGDVDAAVGERLRRPARAPRGGRRAGR